MNLDRRRKMECYSASCGLDKGRCLVKLGTSCIRNGGNRIPVMGMPSERRSFKAQTTAFRPYWITSGFGMDEGRE